MGTLKIMDGSGDSHVIWDPSRPEEVENARRSFNDLRARKYNAYGVKKDGERGELITAFDPELGKIILAPALRGG